MIKWFRRNRGKQQTSPQSLALRLRKLEQQISELQKRIEGYEHRELSQRNLEGRLEKLEQRVVRSENERSVYRPDDSGSSTERTNESIAEEDRRSSALRPTAGSSRSLEDNLDNTVIEAAISVYKQLSFKSGDLFVPLSKYFAELKERRITVDEMDSRNILDKVAREYPGSVRIEQVRGKPEKQIAILDEYLNRQNRR